MGEVLLGTTGRGCGGGAATQGACEVTRNEAGLGDLAAHLREILKAGNITADNDSMTRLGRDLWVLGQQYRLIRSARADRPRRQQVLDCLAEIGGAVAKVSAIIADDGGLLGIEFLLDAFGWRACDGAHLRRLRDAAGRAICYVEAKDPHGPTLAFNEQPETWLFIELYKVYKRLSGRTKIGLHGPLDRFIRRAVAAIGGDIVVPDPAALTARLRAALDRHNAL
jgi:hypothetical protein